jgi:hypothetical protein
VAATPLGTGARGLSRIPALREAVDRDPGAGFLLQGEDADRFTALLKARGLPARAEPLDAYTLFTEVAEPVRRDVSVCRCIPTPLDQGEIALLGALGPERVTAGDVARYHVRIRNGSPFPVSNNVRVSYHWLRADGSAAVWDGERASSLGWPAPGSEGTMEVPVRVNLAPGRYRLMFDVADEGVSWLGTAAGRLPVVKVEVVTH